MSTGLNDSFCPACNSFDCKHALAKNEHNLRLQYYRFMIGATVGFEVENRLSGSIIDFGSSNKKKLTLITKKNFYYLGESNDFNEIQGRSSPV